MQKRLLALVATVAMVLSMFAGVAFAATGPVDTRYYDLQWTKNAELTFSAITAKDNVINYYADFSLIPETTNPLDITAKWIGIGIAKPALFGSVEIAGYYYTLTREDGTVASGYSEIDTFAGAVKGLEWGLNANKYRTAKITIKWLNASAQQVGVDETFTFNFIDTRLQQVSYPYVAADSNGVTHKYADFQVLENGVPVDLEHYKFVAGVNETAGKKDTTVAKVKLGAINAVGTVNVAALRNTHSVSQLAALSLDISSLPYKVQGIQETIPAGETSTLTPVFYFLDAGKASPATSFDITYEGAGLKKATKENVTSIEVAPTKTGNLVLTITAKAVVGSKTVTVGTDVVEVKVTGYNLSVDPSSVLVDKAGTVTIVLKDEDGKPINNADITIGDSSYSNLSIKPNNGVYEIAYKATDAFIKVAEKKTVTATIPTGKDGSGDPTFATVTGTLLVLGKDVYAVTSNLAKDVLAGQKTQLTLQVKDGSTAVFPARVKVLDDEGKQVGSDIVPLKSGDNTVVTLPAFTEEGEYTIVVENSDAKKIGTLPINVQLPILKLSAEKLTNNVTSAFTVELLDPTADNKPLQWLLGVEVEHATVHNLKLAGKAVFGVDTYYLGRLEKYELSTLLTADYDAAEDAEEVSGLIFTATGDAEIEFDVVPIADAKLIANPPTMAINQKGSLTLTLVDANEAPLAGYTVLQGTTEFTTDENGQFVYTVSRMAGNIEFVANLAKVKEDGKDVVKTVTTTVKMADDTEAPTVTYEAEVKTAKTTIVIADNVRLDRVRIKGVEIDLFGRNPYEHTVTLVPGVNKFHIEAIDKEGNLFNDVIEINYVTSSVVLKGEQVKRQGAFNFVQARQFEELGAKFTWNNTTKTASFVLGETKVEVTIGSTTAMVNGKAVTMPAAPFIENERTYIPVRFISEALGWKVDWAVGDIVTISLP